MYEEIGKKLKQNHGANLKEAYHLEKKEAGENTPPGEMPDFAKAVKALRKEKDLSLEKLSELTGIKKQTLHSIENYSTRNPSFPNLEKIASALNITVNDLLLMARAEFHGNLFKTTIAQRWSVSFEVEKGFSIHSYSPLGLSKRDFFVGVMTIQPKKKLRYWKFVDHSKACIQPWDGKIIFTFHGRDWKEEEEVLANQTLYFDPSIPHSFENPSTSPVRMLLTTHPSLF